MGSDKREFLNLLRTDFSFREDTPLVEYIPLRSYVSVSAHSPGRQGEAHHLTITDPVGMDIPLYPGGSRLTNWLPEGSYTTPGWIPDHGSILISIFNKLNKTIGKALAISR